jgi:Mrr N-terminal domain
MYCQDVYTALAVRFPYLTNDELSVPYRNSISHWANRVQFARQHLVTKGWFLHSTMSGGRGFWAISKHGRRGLAELESLGNRLLAELEAA